MDKMENLWQDNGFWNSYFINEEDEIGIHDGGSSYFVFQNKIEVGKKLTLRFNIYSYDHNLIKQNAFSFGCGFIDNPKYFNSYDNDGNELELPNSLYFHSTASDKAKLHHQALLRFLDDASDIYKKIGDIGNKNYTTIYNEYCVETKFQNNTTEHTNIDYNTECVLEVEDHIAEITFGGNIIYRFRLPTNDTYVWFYMDSFRDTHSCFKMISYSIC